MKELVLDVQGKRIELDVLCPSCGASGDACTVCARAGFVLTEEGRTFVRLIRRHLWGDGS
jgi:hypothetical protein